MTKPRHVFETRRAVAYPAEDGPVEPPANDPRGLRVVLQGRDGRVRGHLGLGVFEQRACDDALADPDVPFAVACWVWARGGRRVRLVDRHGRCVVDRPIDVRTMGAGDAGARRIVSLAPSNADLIAELGHIDRLVAVEDSTDAPGTEACERLGPDLGPDLDRIVSLAPDLVLASLTVPGMERVVTGLHVRGVPYRVLAPRTLGHVLDDVVRVGGWLGDPECARALVERLAAQRRRIEERVRAAVPARPARVYLEWWPRPMYSPGRDCISNEVLALAGAENVFADRAGSSVEISAEDLRAADPDVCIVSWCGVPAAKLDPARLRRRPGLEALAAVREGRVHAVDEAMLGRPGPRLFDAAEHIAGLLRPESRPRAQRM